MKYFSLFILFVSMSLTLDGQTVDWVYCYDGPGHLADWADPVIFAPDGNIYAGGYSIGADHDLTVVCLSDSGTENWVYRYVEPDDTFGYATGIVYGEDGNIYVSGISTGVGQTGTGYDFIVISLTDLGAERWVYRYNGAGNDDDCAYSLVYGPDENIYVAGTITDIGTDNEFAVMSLSTSGEQNWMYTYNGPANQYDRAYDITFGAAGNLYVTGHSCGLGGAEYDITVISLTLLGEERWIYRYNGSGNARDRSFSIAYGDGDVYSAGYAIGAGTAYDFIVISLDTSGIENWKYIYDGPISSTDRCNCVVYGLDGNIYACGHSINASTGFDGVVVSLTPSGTERWIYRYDRQGEPFGFEELWSIDYGLDSTLYIAGYSSDTLFLFDFTVINLTSSGTENWVYWYNGPGNGNDEAYTVVYGSDGNAYAAGYSQGSGTARDFTVIRLNSGTSITEEETWFDHHSNLFAIPNPFSEKSVIEFSLKNTQDISLKVYDVRGALVRTLSEGEKTNGSHRITWDGRDNEGREVSSGCYILKFEDSQGFYAKKLVKMGGER